MTEKLILAVDLGTSGMKVALITVSGKVLGWEAESVQLLITPDGGAEQSPNDLRYHLINQNMNFNIL